MMDPQAPPPPLKGLAGRRVLVVEDETVISMFIEDALSGLGCHVVGPARRVQQALDLIERNSIDAAILDLNLGRDGDSYPIADALTLRGLPFVFSTGYGRQGLRPAYRGHACLAKPFAGMDLENALLRLLGEA